MNLLTRSTEQCIFISISPKQISYKSQLDNNNTTTNTSLNSTPPPRSVTKHVQACRLLSTRFLLSHFSTKLPQFFASTSHWIYLLARNSGQYCNFRLCAKATICSTFTSSFGSTYFP